MINAKDAPLYKGFLKIFFFSLLAMIFGFLGGDRGAQCPQGRRADLVGAFPPPAPPHKGPGCLLWRSPRAARLRSLPSSACA